MLRIVSTLALNLAVPVFCKIRLLDGGEEETVAFARQLEAAGCALLAVHGRLRGDPMHRRKGPADLSQVRAVKAALRIPVLTNGNVRSADELLASLRETGADGVMSAEAALDDAALFGRAAEAARRRRRLRRQARAAKELRAARRGGRTLSADERRAVAAGKAARAELRAMPAFAKRGGAATSGATARSTSPTSTLRSRRRTRRPPASPASPFTSAASAATSSRSTSCSRRSSPRRRSPAPHASSRAAASSPTAARPLWPAGRRLWPSRRRRRPCTPRSLATRG